METSALEQSEAKQRVSGFPFRGTPTRRPRGKSPSWVGCLSGHADFHGPHDGGVFQGSPDWGTLPV